LGINLKEFGVAQINNRRPVTEEASFIYTAVYMGFVVNKVALGHNLLQALQFSLPVIIPPAFHIHPSSERGKISSPQSALSRISVKET
jgi:hypothetical protein